MRVDRAGARHDAVTLTSETDAQCLGRENAERARFLRRTYARHGHAVPGMILEPRDTARRERLDSERRISQSNMKLQSLHDTDSFALYGTMDMDMCSDRYMHIAVCTQRSLFSRSESDATAPTSERRAETKRSIVFQTQYSQGPAQGHH